MTAELATLEKVIEKGLAYIVGTPTKLSPGERERLAEYVAVVDKSMDSFLAVGAALIGIREGRLYREAHPTFEAFCRNKWSMSRPRAYQLIASTKMVNRLSADLSTTVDTPTSERQVRPLTALPAAQQAAAWQESVETAPGGRPTAAHVQAVVDKIKTPAPTTEKSENEWDKKQYAIHMEEHVRLVMEHLEAIQLYGKTADKLKYGIKIIRWCAGNLAGFDAALKAVRAQQRPLPRRTR